MREFVLNEGSLLSLYACEADAISALDCTIRGVAALVNAGIGAKSLRSSRPLHEIQITPGVDLWRVAQLALRNPRTRSSASLLLGISERGRVPIEDGLDPDLAERLLLADLVTPLAIGARALVLCALSERIALGFPTTPQWDVDVLTVDVVVLDQDGNQTILPYIIDHVSRELHAAPIAERHRANRITCCTPHTLWENREALFPHLSFGIDVQDHLLHLGQSIFREAVRALRELDRTAATWKTLGTGRPPYLSKVTPESGITMQQYGALRVFRDTNGAPATFELHTRLQSGFRIHIREVRSEFRIEIGYVGRHLRTQKY